MSDRSRLLEYLYQALAADYGIVISTDNPKLMRQRLYTARRNSGDSDLDCIQIRQSPTEPDTQLWLVKGSNDAS